MEYDMKTSVCNPSPVRFLYRSLAFGLGLGFWVLLWIGVIHAVPAQAKANTVAPKVIASDTTWTEAGSPYLIDSSIFVNPGVTLTIEAGVEVNGLNPDGNNYLFQVDGRLIAQGTAEKPILFHNSIGPWSGILINGTMSETNRGSELDYVIVDGGGLGASGVGGNLSLTYVQAEVRHCQFNNGRGDGILGNDASTGGMANIYDSSFTNNAGFAVMFEDGSVNPVLAHLTASGNGADIPFGGDGVYIGDNTLEGAHTWENMGLPYMIVQTTVGPDGVLTIEPGVQVLAYLANDGLDVEGRLMANGTPSQPVRFDPVDPASGWSGIAIAGSEAQPSNGSILNEIVINQGGFAGNCNLYISYGEATVTNALIDGSEDSGICLEHGASLVMSDTLLSNNGQYAIDVLDASAQFTLSNLTASGNMSDTIGVEIGTMTGAHTWQASGIDTYDLYGYLTIAPTGTLVVEPGVTVLIGEGMDITVHGALIALGTAWDPIIFSGETQTPGWWGGLSFEGTPELHALGLLEDVTIEYGGYGGSALVGIYNADVTFNKCVLRYGSSDAIKIFPSGVQAAVAEGVMDSQGVEIRRSEIYEIDHYAINNEGSQAVQAAFNWWGDASGPQAEGNPGGTGAVIVGTVVYQPYLTGPNGVCMFLPVVGR